jgi:hypothetical protein
MRTRVIGLLLTMLGAGCSSGSSDAVEGTEDDLVATFDGNGHIDLTKPSHVLLVGDSVELASQPLFAATTRARRYAELYPNDQIVLFTTKDVTDATLAATGATVVHDEAIGNVAVADLSRLSGAKLLQALDRFQKIASIDFFGHSSPFYALLEEDGADNKLSATLPGNAGILADNFARDRNPYVTLNGCNGGVKTAAQLSLMWQLPVSGALTGSLFQAVRSDGRWYFDDPAFYPATTSRVSKNAVSFTSSSASCAKGGCTRMKPQDAPYVGVWSLPGGMQYGLSYYKFFCNYEDGDADTCSRGMAQSLYAFPSVKPIDATSTEADVREVLADFFCSGNKDGTWFDTCKGNLAAAADANASFSPMKTANDYSLECDFTKCEEQFRCTQQAGVPQKGTCVWVSADCAADAAPSSCKKKNTTKMTTATEYGRYLTGHRLLGGG